MTHRLEYAVTCLSRGPVIEQYIACHEQQSMLVTCWNMSPEGLTRDHLETPLGTPYRLENRSLVPLLSPSRDHHQHHPEATK